MKGLFYIGLNYLTNIIKSFGFMTVIIIEIINVKNAMLLHTC